MVQLTGTFDTPNASKYLQQLCKHFGHKRPVEFDETEGAVTFDFTTAQISADAERLTVVMELEDPETEERARMVIDKHLERFAFREDFKAMDWAKV